MLSKISDFFNSNINTASTESAEEKSERISLATCALLLEMAHADSEFGDEEKNLIISILKDKFNLSNSDASELIDLADFERKESLDLWQFTHLINENFSRQDKFDVLKILWSVVYADGKVDMHEEYLMRKLSNLLDMEHRDMIESKIQARDNL
jgi:uncharacterized tellurite resistance protein B-like protein